MWIVSHEGRSRQTFASSVLRTLGHVVANTEGGRKVIGRWNRPTNFDPLIGDLLDMSASIWTNHRADNGAPSVLGRRTEGVRKASWADKSRSGVVFSWRLGAVNSGEPATDPGTDGQSRLRVVLESLWSRPACTEGGWKAAACEVGANFTKG
jgi:hypothetical protein